MKNGEKPEISFFSVSSDQNSSDTESTVGSSLESCVHCPLRYDYICLMLLTAVEDILFSIMVGENSIRSFEIMVFL